MPIVLASFKLFGSFFWCSFFGCLFGGFCGRFRSFNCFFASGFFYWRFFGLFGGFSFLGCCFLTGVLGSVAHSFFARSFFGGWFLGLNGFHCNRSCFFFHCSFFYRLFRRNNNFDGFALFFDFNFH